MQENNQRSLACFDVMHSDSICHDELAADLRCRHILLRIMGSGSMLVAALYDIHGNLPALKAVLEDVRQLNVSEVVVGGDVLPGPGGQGIQRRAPPADR